MSERCLIVSADDLGLTEGHNRAISHAHKEGILTSASLLANGGAFDDAVARVRAWPLLGIGVHLTLLEGMAVRPKTRVPGLVRDGRFGTRVGGLFFSLSLWRIQLAQVRGEWRAQIEKVLATGLTVTHFDSHKHIHLHPQLLSPALDLAGEYGVARMRLSRPGWLARTPQGVALGLLSIWARWRMARQGVRTPDALLGLEHSGGMDTARVVAAIRAPWQGVCELMTHPAYRTPMLEELLARGYHWVARYRFQAELAALCSPQVRDALNDHGIQLVSYAVL